MGHDESGRPVIYANFAQAATHKNSVDDVVTHVTYLIESAKATMDVGVTTWVFVIDCTGAFLLLNNYNIIADRSIVRIDERKKK